MLRGSTVWSGKLTLEAHLMKVWSKQLLTNSLPTILFTSTFMSSAVWMYIFLKPCTQQSNRNIARRWSISITPAISIFSFWTLTPRRHVAYANGFTYTLTCEWNGNGIGWMSLGCCEHLLADEYPPVINLASSDTRYETSPAISSGVASYPIGEIVGSAPCERISVSTQLFQR